MKTRFFGEVSMKCLKSLFRASLIFALELLMGVNTRLFAQRLHFGPEIGYLTNMKMHFTPTIVGNAVIFPTYQNNQFYDGYRIGLFGERQIVPLVGIKAGIGFSETFGGGIPYQIESTSPPPATRWGMGTLVTHQIFDVNAMGSVRPFSNNKRRFLRNIQVKLGVSYWRFGVVGETPLNLLPEGPGTLDPILIANERTRYQHAINQSFLKSVMLWRAAITLPIINKLFLEGFFERTLTPVGRELIYRDTAYPFEQNTQRVVISLGYRFAIK